MTVLKTVDGQPLSPEAERLLDYVRTRPAELDAAGVRERVRAAALELEKIVDSVPESDIRRRPLADKWNIAEVVDHIAQTQIRSAEELRHLLAGRRPSGPPVYEALRTGAAAWAPWQELVDGLRSANHELIELLKDAPGAAEKSGATVRTILVINHAFPDGGTGTQIFPADLDWKQYALLQRLHLLDHRTQIRKLREALTSSAAAS
jgi:DinB family protein